mmetsp:Transcript_121661/g.349676  ORF Transcript_121661/g.349676 Transcript_121661/m.349676 type:complete len:300 (-) Transcript_121661:913-1812(-)
MNAAAAVSLRLHEQVAWRQNVALCGLRAALERQGDHLLAVERVRHGNLHLHLHRLQDAQRRPGLQLVTDRDLVGQQLAGHHRRQVVRVAGLRLPRACLGRRADGRIRVRHRHRHGLALMKEGHGDVLVGCGAEALELHLCPVADIRGVHEQLEGGALLQCAWLAMEQLRGHEQRGKVCALLLRRAEVQTLLLVAEGDVALMRIEIRRKVLGGDEFLLLGKGRLQLRRHVGQELVHLRRLRHERLPPLQADQDIAADLELAAAIHPLAHGLGRLGLDAILDHDRDAEAELVLRERGHRAL